VGIKINDFLIRYWNSYLCIKIPLQPREIFFILKKDRKWLYKNCYLDA
jgi:hypothetical protein